MSIRPDKESSPTQVLSAKKLIESGWVGAKELGLICEERGFSTQAFNNFKSLLESQGRSLGSREKVTADSAKTTRGYFYPPEVAVELNGYLDTLERNFPFPGPGEMSLIDVLRSLNTTDREVRRKLGKDAEQYFTKRRVRGIFNPQTFLTADGVGLLGASNERAYVIAKPGERDIPTSLDLLGISSAQFQEFQSAFKFITGHSPVVKKISFQGLHLKQVEKDYLTDKAKKMLVVTNYLTKHLSNSPLTLTECAKLFGVDREELRMRLSSEKFLNNEKFLNLPEPEFDPGLIPLVYMVSERAKN
jgi:hypothetical protein